MNVCYPSVLHTLVVTSGYLPSHHLKVVWPLSSDPCHQKDIFTQRTAAHWMFSLFHIIVSKS